MTDKVQKIREEIEKRLKGERFLSSDKEYNYLLSFIDSLQEEHKLKPKFQEGNKIVYVGERKELDTDEHTILYVYDDMYVTTWGKKIPFKFQDDYKLIEEPVSDTQSSVIFYGLTGSVGSPKEEPVSEDLEEAAVEWFNSVKYKSDLSGTPINAFKAGAKWQIAKLMKDATEAVVAIDSGGYPYIDKTIELYDYDKDIPLAKEGDKYKVILIKEE